MTSSAKPFRGQNEDPSHGDMRGRDNNPSSGDRVARRLAEFAANTVRAGNAVLLAVSTETRTAITAAFRELYFAASAAESEHALSWLDAEEILGRARAERQFDREALRAMVKGVIQQTRALRNPVVLRCWEESTGLATDPALRSRLVELWSEVAERERIELVSPRDLPNVESNSVHESGQRLAYDAAVLARTHQVAGRGAVAANEVFESGEELVDFLENSNEPLHSLAPDGTLLWANREELALLGYAREEYVGRQAAEFFVDSSRAGELLRLLSLGESIRDYEAELRCKDGSRKCVLINATVQYKDGRAAYARCFMRDITARRRVETELLEKKRELESAVARLQCQSDINETVMHIASSLNSELDLDALVQKITDEARQLCRAEFGAFFYNVLNENRESYVLYTLSGVDRAAFENFPMPRNTPVFAPTFEGSGIVRLDDVTQDPRYGQNAPHRGMPDGHLPVRSYLAAPVKSRSGEVLGGLFFGHAKPGVFREQDESTLALLSAHAGVALDNAKLFQAVRSAQSAAQAERENLRELFVQSPALITIFKGPAHVFDFVNAAAKRLLGRDDVVGKTAREVLPEMDDRIRIFDQVYRSGERYVADNLSVTRDWNGNGRPVERFFNVVYQPYRGPNDAIEGVMVFGFETTEQVLASRKIESIVKELEVANRTKDEFLATVSHELRTPLNAILGWVRMLRSGSLPEDKRARALETIDRNASAQAQLIEDLLDVSRIISGKLRLDVTTVDVAAIVDEALESVRPAAVAKGVTLRQTVDPNAGPISGDPDRLRQVVWNLVTNAVKFTPKGGSVHVAVHKQDSDVNITVTDTGQGIPSEFIGHLFEQFRQADSTTTRKHGGLGLGLAIVRSLVELHGGSVRAESEGAGKGACFIVSLPIAPVRSSGFERPPALRMVQSSAFRPQGELEGVHVLVLDDEDDARNVLAEILAEAGARVSTAASVPSAMELVERERPDVIVSDLGMPEQDGYDFIRQLRSIPASSGGRTPAVALTAYCRVEDRTKALAAGFNMHAPKPVEPAELIAGLASLAALFERK